MPGHIVHGQRAEFPRRQSGHGTSGSFPAEYHIRPCGQAMRKPKLGVGTVTAIETTAAIAPERGGGRLLG